MSTAEDYVSLFDVGESKDDLDVSYRDYGGGDDTDEEDLQVKTCHVMTMGDSIKIGHNFSNAQFLQIDISPVLIST